MAANIAIPLSQRNYPRSLRPLSSSPRILSRKAGGSTLSIPRSDRACLRGSSKKSLSYDTKNCTRPKTAQSTNGSSFTSRHNPNEKGISTRSARCIRRLIRRSAASGAYRYFLTRQGRNSTSRTSSTIACDNTRTNRPSSQRPSRRSAGFPFRINARRKILVSNVTR